MQLIEKIPLEAQQLILEACRKGYAAACKNYRKESNGNTFGTDVYNFIAYYLGEAAKTGGPLELISRYPKLRLITNGVVLACHKVGKGKKQNIQTSFPNNNNAVQSIVQQKIPGLDLSKYSAKVEAAIITHMGNPVEGFLSAHICVPDGVNESSGRINSWGETYELLPAVAQVAHFPPEEAIPEIEIKAKPKTKNKGEVERGDATAT
ncbi:MAG: hypothetical protein KGS72_21545 [Cyanobacteria bacterium REEB67]|nr:hypothetical protein [Cyanobacteria bacterium REEB67]